MNCGCCCTNTLEFCNVSVCDSLFDLDIKAQVAGIHKLILDYLQMQVTLSEEFEVGESVIFDISGLNESFQFTGNLFDPDGSKVLIHKGDIDYDCFRFKTVLSIAV